jgi:hypothetical protein
MNNLSNSKPNAGSQSSSESAPNQDAASSLKSSVSADAQELGSKAKTVADGVVEQARETVESRISGGKERVVEGLGSVAEAMRHTGVHLRSRDTLGLTDYVARAADQVDAVSDYLQARKLGDVVQDLSSFARREPAIFLGGAFAVGLLGGRFLKSSHATSSRASQPAVRNMGQTSLANTSRDYTGSRGERDLESRDQATARTLPGSGMGQTGSLQDNGANQGMNDGSSASTTGAV